MNNLKVIILSAYGCNLLPKEFNVDYSNPLWRLDVSLISQIENKNWKLLDNNTELKKGCYYCRAEREGVKYLYPLNDKMNNYSSFDIVEVDISRPWCIEEYDGAEYVHYLDNYDCISEDFNFYKLKG